MRQAALSAVADAHHPLAHGGGSRGGNGSAVESLFRALRTVFLPDDQEPEDVPEKHGSGPRVITEKELSEMKPPDANTKEELVQQLSDSGVLGPRGLEGLEDEDRPRKPSGLPPPRDPADPKRWLPYHPLHMAPPTDRSGMTDIFPPDRGTELPKPTPAEILEAKTREKKIKDLQIGEYPFLKFVRQSEWLKSSDITSSRWLGMPFNCKTNLQGPNDPFLHPNFVFKVPVHGVRVRLGGAGQAPFWDVIYRGRPGSDFEVPNNSTPTGGTLPLFPEFCPPLQPHQKWELRLTEVDDSPRFDEKLFLKVPSDIAEPERPPWAPRETAIARMEDGAVENEPLEEDDTPPADIDFETGEKIETFL